MMIKIGRDEVVNSAHVVHAKIDHYGETVLLVELITGRTIRARDTSHCLDGFSAYKALDQILAAQAE